MNKHQMCILPLRALAFDGHNLLTFAAESPYDLPLSDHVSMREEKKQKLTLLIGSGYKQGDPKLFFTAKKLTAPRSDYLPT